MNAGGMGRTLGALALLVAAVGACSGGGDDHGAEDGGSTDDPAENAFDQPAGDGAEDSAVPGSAELEAALLTEGDLPGGLVDLHLNYTAVETCGMRTEMPESVQAGELPTGAAAFALADDPIVPDVWEKIVVAPAGEGAAVFQRAHDLLDMNCSSGGESDGLAFLSAADLVVPTLGDETVAKSVKIEQLASGTTAGID